MARTDQMRAHEDTQFRWLIGLMLTTVLGVAALLVKAF